MAYPVIGVWILFNHRRDATTDERGPVPAPWGRRCLVAQGVVLTLAGLALLLAPGPMADAWPWPVTSLLAQIYSAPVLAYGVGSVLLARDRTWREMRVGVLAIALFAIGALVASLIHLELFAADDLAAWIWFGALGAITAVAALLAASSRTLA